MNRSSHIQTSLSVKTISRRIETNLRQLIIGQDYSRHISDDKKSVKKLLDNVNKDKTYVQKNQELI